MIVSVRRAGREVFAVCSFQDILREGEVGLDSWRVMPRTGDFVTWIPPMTVTLTLSEYGLHTIGELVVHGSTATMRDVEHAILQMGLWSARLDPGDPQADRNRLPTFPPYTSLKVRPPHP